MNLWLVIAPALLGLPFAGLWIWFADPVGRIGLGLREAAAWSAVLWSAFAVLTAQLLSIGAGHDPGAPASGHLNRSSLALVWLAAAAIGVLVLWRRRASVAQLAQTSWRRLRELRGLDRYLVIAVAVCVVLVAVVSLFSAPTTWDSMTYHLARVSAWLGMGGAAHYATASLPQLFQPPGAELLVAQLQAIVGGDRLAASVQTVAYLLSIGAASLVAKQLGAGRRGQLLAAFLLASAPMAIMQGSSTQNDLLVGLWLLTAAALALGLLEDDRLAVARGLVASTAVALALLTKGTAWIYLPPILLLLAWVLLKRLGPARFSLVALLGLAIVLLLNAVPWQANHQTFGQFAYSDNANFDYSTDRHAPSTLVSNLVRNAAIYVGTPSSSINEFATEAIDGTFGALGIDPDDPATTFPGLDFDVPKAGPDEAHGPSVLLFLLGLWALSLTFFARSFRTRERLIWALVVLADVLLFALLIKWQTWHSRLHLPVVLLSIPLIAVALELRPSSPSWRGRLVAFVVVAASLLGAVHLVLNVDRPLIGYAGHRSILVTPRETQYFAARPELEVPYRSVTTAALEQRAGRVAMIGGFDDWYYPLSALLGPGVRTSYISVPNASARYPQADPASLDAVICLSCDPGTQEMLRAAGLRPAKGQYFHVQATAVQHGVIVELWLRERGR